MEITIRTAQPADYKETETVTREAFWNHFSPGCVEHYVLHVMRTSSAFVKELDLVAVHAGKIVGSAACAKGIVKGDDGTHYRVLTLGPISVLPEFQRRGIGGLLLASVKQQAKKMGERAVFLCGDPAYYARHGFLPAKSFGIRTAENCYAAALQAFELYENALRGAKGRYFEDAVYAVDEKDAEEYDKRFPQRQRVSGTPSQRRFLEIAALQEKA